MKVNKTTVLTGLSIAGIIGTTVVTAYMAPKAERAIKAKICKEPITIDGVDGSKIIVDYKKADKIELVKTAAPYYIPTILLCSLTITLTLLNHKEYKKELLAMSAASAYLAANRDNLKKIAEKPEVKKVVGKIFPTKEEFKHQTIETTGYGDLLCIDGYSGRIFRSSQDAVVNAQEQLNDIFLDPEGGYACMNDYFRFLNIEQSGWGEEYGWVNNEDWYYRNEPIQFSNELIAADAPGNEFGEPIFYIDIEDGWQPMWGWMEV